MAIRVALLEDNERFREQLLQRLGFFPEIRVLFEARSAEDFFAQLAEQQEPPDVALLDIGLPGASGIEAVARLNREQPAVGCLMITVFEEPEKILAAIQAGAAGYLLKDAPAEEVVAAIREVDQGGVPLSRPVARHVLRLMGRLRPTTSVPEGPSCGEETEPLSAREIELLEQIVGGGTEAEIAERLCISPHTVRTHVKNIYRKLRVNSRAAAVRVAYERRLLDG